jgi:hypothetical protein
MVVAVLTLVRAFASPFGVTTLDVVAPFAFLVLMLLLSLRVLVLAEVRRV